MIDAAPRGAECREQTWPYIDRRCLNYGKAQPQTAAVKPETSGHAPANALPQPRIQETRIVPAAPARIDTPPAALQQNGRDNAGQPALPSADDVSVADNEPVEYAPTEEELQAQARAEARQRRKARQRNHGHFWIGPFRF